MQRRLAVFGISLSLALVSFGFGGAKTLPPLETVPQLDLARYAGTWYEIGSIRHRFQKDCVASKAIYTVRDDGDVDVYNECRKLTFDGEISSIHGKAWVSDPSAPGKLRVRFFWPFSAKYWVIELGENYEYAVVGHPDREYLWVLSRTPTMDDRLYDEILSRAKDKYYDISLVQRTPQPKQP